MPISIGVFDHMDSGDFPPHELYENRMKLIEAYDAAGFYGYHVAEHHQTSLGMAPTPGLFLAAAAARTTRIKLGPLIYIVPTYSPLRLIEEICMLDHLSKGRYQFGMGRGISPFETGFHGVRSEESHAMYREAVDIVLKGLTQETLSHDGKYWSYKDVPMVLRPYQAPHPPLWYGPSNAEGAAAAAERKLNIVINNPRHLARAINDAYSTAYAKAHGGNGTPMMGLVRHIYVGDSDAAALRIATPAYRRWKLSHVELWRRMGADNHLWPEQLDEAIAKDGAIVGSPETVIREINDAMAVSGCNYLVGRFAFGNMSYADTKRSVDLFISEVMSKIA
jgi:alkanesulfonate monooxygenase SsuD/methylene tetrahydromethanopterin reductase-like flavin-dependent oxidoreductase (luciferase family)